MVLHQLSGGSNRPARKEAFDEAVQAVESALMLSERNYLGVSGYV